MNQLFPNEESVEPILIGNVEVIPSTPEKREIYLSELSKAIDHLNNHVGSEGWWIVGGLARDSYLGNDEFVVQDPYGNLRDVDIVVKNDKVQDFNRAVQSYRGPLNLGGGILQMYIKIQDDIATLNRGDVNIEVPIEVFDSKKVNLNSKNGRSVEINTFPLKTLLYLYYVGSQAKIREKDFYNALAIARKLRNEEEDYLTDDKYEGFREFRKRAVIEKVGKIDLISFVKYVAVSYKESTLNDILPIDNPRFRNFLFKMWNIINR